MKWSTWDTEFKTQYVAYKTYMYTMWCELNIVKVERGLF